MTTHSILGLPLIDLAVVVAYFTKVSVFLAKPNGARNAYIDQVVFVEASTKE